MTNKELQEKLKEFPDDAEVYFFNWDSEWEEVLHAAYEPISPMRDGQRKYIKAVCLSETEE